MQRTKLQHSEYMTRISDIQHYHYAECPFLFVASISVVMLSVVWAKWLSLQGLSSIRQQGLLNKNQKEANKPKWIWKLY